MATDPAFVCPRCGARSWNPNDGANGYCGRCHWWTGDPILGAIYLVPTEGRTAMARPTDDQIDEQRAKAADSKQEHGPRGQWPGQSYEDGVEAALDWIMGDAEEAPMEEA